MPKPPALPPDWLELSKTDRDEAAADAEQSRRKNSRRAPMAGASYALPRGQAGWVLTRLVSMAIPDEVAQYAEGKRIVSYFPLGTVQDDEKKKNIWLWTTTTNSKQPWDFDSSTFTFVSIVPWDPRSLPFQPVSEVPPLAHL